MRRYKNKPSDHLSIGQECKACGKPFREGDDTTYIPIGPGDDPKKQDYARRGIVYDPVSIEVHFSCATGERRNEERASKSRAYNTSIANRKPQAKAS